MNLFIILIIVFIIAYRIKILWSYKKTKNSGSNLHIQLSALFAFLTLIPSVLVTLFSLIFFDQGVKNWFSGKVQTALLGSKYISESYFKEHSNNLRNDLVFLSKEINNEKVAFFTDKDRLTNLLESLISIKLLDEVIIFERSGQLLAKIGNSFIIDKEPPPPLWTIFRADDGDISIFTNKENNKVRGLIKLDRVIPTYLYAGKNVDSLVLNRLDNVNTAANEYFDLEKKIKNFQFQFYQLFIAVNLLVISLSIWFGLLFANKIIFPIKTIISASKKISQGNLKTRIQNFSEFQDFNVLSKSLNLMVDKFLEQKNNLFKAKQTLDLRRKFTEAVIEGVSAGILYIDFKSFVLLYNKRSQEILEKNVKEKNLIKLFPEMNPLIIEASKSQRLLEREFNILINDKVKTLSLKISPQLQKEKLVGFILTFDDISELISAQKKAAWSNVARYLAHEIKNPLTPIKISTQRLQSNFKKELLNKDIFEKCSQTIIRQVNDIEKLVTEFSEFARMPISVFSRVDLSKILIKEFNNLEVIHKNIAFKCESKFQNLFIKADKSQIMRVFNNILKNAIESNVVKKKKKIHAIIKKNNTSISVLIEDNGEGFPKNKENLFDPYITNKKNGTGLGLSICKKIIEEHYGQIKLSNSKSLGGASVEIILPLKPDIPN
tara:strand:+ start:62100 stop:64085 length:1986 start_codon:yes stop_codon:yes gene_type:complete